MFHPRHCLRARAKPGRRLLPLVAALFPLAAFAQSQLDPVIVTGTREPQRLSRSAADIVLIDAETIRDSGADSVEDLLRRQAGLQLARNGGPGMSSGYFIRGASTNSTVVLVDGVRIGSATLGQAELEALSLAQIERIEVLRGPASSLYGADAVGGVIQIFTRRGDGPARFSANLAVGGEGSSEGQLAVSGAQAGFDYAASMARESSDGVSAIRPNDQYGSYNPDRDGFTRKTAQLRLGFAPAAGHRIGLSANEARLNAQYDSADYPPPNYAPDASPDFRNHLKTRVVALDYRGQLSQLWTSTLRAANTSDDLRSGGTLLSRYKTDRQQFTWQNALRFDADQQLVLAYEYLRERVAGDVYASKPSTRNKALIAGYTGQFGASGLEASLRHDDNSAYGNNTTGSLGFSHALAANLKLRAMAGTTFRAPTFNERLYPNYGIPELEPERGRSLELGLAWQSGASSASATVYRNKVRNLIGYDPDPNGTNCPAGYFGCAGNTSRATLQGGTLSAAQRWGGFSLRGTVDFVDAKDDQTGLRLNRRAAHQESLSADYDAGAWKAGASVLDVGSRPDGGVRLGGYAVVDLRASWRFLPQWRLEAKLLNAGDHRVEPVRDYQGLGRQAWIGLRFDSQGL